MPAGTETPQTQPAAEADADLAPPAVAFQVEYWLSLAAAMEADASHRLLDGLAPLMAAMGRTKEARELMERGRHVLASDTPWACLLPATSPDAVPDYEVCLDTQGPDLPRDALPFAKALIGPDGTLLNEAPSDRLESLLSSFVQASSALVLLGSLLLLIGMVLLVLAPRLIRRYRVADFGLQGFRFAAAPFPTYFLFLIWFTMMLTVHLAVAALARQIGLDPSTHGIPIMVSAYIIYAIGGILLIQKMGQPQVQPLTRAVDLQWADLSGKVLLFGFAAYCVALPVVLALTHISGMLFGSGPEINPAIPQLLSANNDYELWALVLNVCIIAPVFEEILFRGFLFQQFKRFFSVPNAAALSALIFASVHLSIESFIPLFGLGLVLAFSYHYVQSLWASILLHMLWNSATVAVVILLFT